GEYRPGRFAGSLPLDLRRQSGFRHQSRSFRAWAAGRRTANRPHAGGAKALRLPRRDRGPDHGMDIGPTAVGARGHGAGEYGSRTGGLGFSAVPSHGFDDLLIVPVTPRFVAGATAAADKSGDARETGVSVQ